MAKGAANESQLAKLHATLAKVIEEQLQERILVNKEEVDDEGADPAFMFTASPALLTVASRFLKDNDITADVGSADDRTDAIKRRLEELQGNRGKVVRLADITPVAADG